MDDAQMKELIQDMGLAIGSAAGGAIEKTLGDEAVARREEQKDRREKEKAFLEARQEALDAMLGVWRSAQQKREQRASRAVEQYCSDCDSDIQKRLQKDPNMPGSVNWEERCAAFRKMDNRDKLLMRIEQTIGSAEKAIRHNAVIDPGTAISQAADKLFESYQRLRGLSVGAHKPDKSAEEVEAAAEGAVLDRRAGSRDAFASIEDAVVNAFREAMPDDADKVTEHLDDDSLEKRFEREMEQALITARSAARAAEGANAKRVAGSSLDCSVIVPFSGDSPVEKKHDGAELLQLASEVRTSFKTYKQVIEANGVFSAFPDGKSDFGKCRGNVWDFWWDDDPEAEYTGRKHQEVEGIESAVEEDAEGDTVSRTIERMREFNKERYWGMLDDDHLKHVDHFWYGFGKLMEFTSSMFEIDLSGFRSHFAKAAIALGNQAHALGSLMDDKQLDDFCKQINGLRKGDEGVR